jgi:hypothetical protein
MIVKLSRKVGDVKNKFAGIKSKYALNVTVRYTFEGHSMLKQHCIINLKDMLSMLRISQMLRLF